MWLLLTFLLRPFLKLQNLPTRSFESIATAPAEGSSSPPRIFMKVDLPQPFAPMRP